MLIKLIRNQSEGASITGRLVINGRWFCNTLERVGYQIPALCYHLSVTYSPKFKRLLPIVQNVPRTFPQGCQAQSGSPRSSWVRGESGGTCRLMTQCVSHRDHVAERVGIRFHRGTKPQHSTGCILLPADKEIVMPGDQVTFKVKLLAPVAMNDQDRFAIREGGKTVGSGVITKGIK